MIIPDCVSPIIGYRAWHWSRSGLASLDGEFWPPRNSIQAICKRSFDRHPVPKNDCTCGIHAARSLDQLRMMGYTNLGIYGEVYLWGTVVEHEWGWRAQFAYPKTIVLDRERLIFDRFVQRELNAEETQSLEILTSYGAGVFLAGAEKNIQLWTKLAGGLNRLREAAAGTLATFRVAVLIEDQRQRLLDDYCSFAYSALACFSMGMSGSASFQRAKKSW